MNRVLVIFGIGVITNSVVWAQGRPSAETVARTLTNYTQPRGPSIRYRLGNGLDVVLEENHRLPLVAVRVQYHVGSRNDPAEYTGLAHTVEHMMFERESVNGTNFSVAAEGLGATSLNATTDRDHTDYFCIVPSNAVHRILWLEADRMAYLLSGLNPQMLLSEQRAIRNEYRMRVEGSFGAQLSRFVHQRMYPRAHPYNNVDEYAEGLAAIQLSQVQWFFQQWYSPSNATLVVVGDFQTAEIVASIRRYFLQIYRHNSPPQAAQPRVAPFRGHTETVPLRTQHGWLAYYWATPERSAGDEATMQVIAELLTGAQGGSLTRRFAREFGSAEAVDALQLSYDISSEFILTAAVPEGQTLNRMVTVLDEELDRLRRNLVDTADLNAIIRAKIQAIRFAQDDLGSRAQSLAEYARSNQRELDLTAQHIERFAAITPETVRFAARYWLSNAGRLSIIGRPEVELGPTQPRATRGQR